MAASNVARSSVHLYSWFVEPICNRASKRWNGNVRVWGLQTPSAPTWWRSSSIARATSSTQLVTRFGTNVFLHGSLCQQFASRVYMNSVGVDMFRNGFPPSWKQSLPSCFSQFTTLKWNYSAHKTSNANNKTVSILKKSLPQQSQCAKRKRVRFDFNLRPVDVPCPQPKRPRVTHHRHKHHPSKQPAHTQSRPSRAAASPAHNECTPRTLPQQPHASTGRRRDANKLDSSKETSRAHNKRNASRRTTNNSNTHSESRSNRRLKSAPETKPHSRHQSSRHKTTAHTRNSARTRNSTSTLVAVPIANSFEILTIRRSNRLEAEDTYPNTKHAAQPNSSRQSNKNEKRTRSSSAPPKPSKISPLHAAKPTTKRTRRRSSVTSKRLEPPSLDRSPSHVIRRRRHSDASEQRGRPTPLEPLSSLQSNASARAAANDLKTKQKSTEAKQSKLNEKSNVAPSSEFRRRSRRLSGQLPVPDAQLQIGIPVESKSNNQSLHVVASTKRRSRRLLERSNHDPKPGTGKQGHKDEMDPPSRKRPRAPKAVLEAGPRLEKENDSGERHSRSPMQRKSKRERPRGSRKKQSSEASGSKAPCDGGQSQHCQTETRRSTRSRPSAEDRKRLQSESANRKKEGVANSTSAAKDDAFSCTSKQTKSTKRTGSKASAKTESNSCKASAVRFAETSGAVLRPRKRVSFGPEAKSDDAVSVAEEGPAGTWSVKQREDFERQRNSVPANDPQYWELIAAGVEGKTAAQCLELWDSSWTSPPSTKRKKVGFVDVENEPRRKKSKMSTPQVIQNVQKASKSKRGRNTAKYRTSVRRLADTFARDTEDDALEPEIVTPKMSWKLTSGRAGVPSLQDGTPGTEVRQKRRNADKGGELATPEILKRGKSFGLREADLYVSLFRRRLGAEPIVPTAKQSKPGVKRILAKKPPPNVAQAFEPAAYGEADSLSDLDSSRDSESSCDGDLFF